MTRQCCGRGPAWVPAIAPGAALVLLPKCPLCLAAWLTAVSGFSFSPASAMWLRGMVVMLWVGALAFAAAPIILRGRRRHRH